MAIFHNSKSEFIIECELRKGGFGSAYVVRPKRNLCSEYVLKEVNLTALNNDWESTGVTSNQRSRLIEKCRSEHLKMQQAHHPNIVQVFGFFEETIDENDMYYLLMEYCEGGDLDRFMKIQSKPIPENTIRNWAKQLVAAISHLHAHDLVHRDIKPANIFLTAANTKVKLGDFGLAKDLRYQQSMSLSITTAMTHAYASPEQLNGDPADKPCDIWALGITLYEMAHFRRPFDGASLAILCINILQLENSLLFVAISSIFVKHSKAPSPFNKDRGYSAEFQVFVNLMLEKDVQKRIDVTQLADTFFLKAENESPIAYSAVSRTSDCSDNDMEELSERELGLKSSLINCRKADKKDEEGINRHLEHDKAWNKAEDTVKKLADRIMALSKNGGIDELKPLITGEIVSIFQQNSNDSGNNEKQGRKDVKVLIAELLAKHVIDEKWHNASPLYYACVNGHLATASFLVEECGCNITERLNHELGEMPIHVACWQGHLRVVEWLCDRWPEMVRAKRLDGATPMHVAALNGRLEIVKFLVLRKKADVEALDDRFGRTPVFWAAQNGHLNVLKFLVHEFKARIDTRDENEGSLPIHLACQEGHLHVVEWLCDGWPDFMVEAKRYDGVTPLHVAAGYGHIDVVKYLVLKKRAIVEVKDSKFKRTPVFWAAQNGHLKVVEFFVQRCNVVVDIQDADQDGWFIVHLAAYNGHTDVVDYLLRIRPDFLDIKAKNGRTPYRIAKENGKAEVARLLRLRGTLLSHRQ